MKKIRVMIVEDSPVVRALLEYSIGRDPRLEVCATTASAQDAPQILEHLSPALAGDCP
jgi:two-component system, chemotaxis family, protein-glutamate methylesterase/glutaminase